MTNKNIFIHIFESKSKHLQGRVEKVELKKIPRSNLKLKYRDYHDGIAVTDTDTYLVMILLIFFDINKSVNIKRFTSKRENGKPH